jgi:hypothetical protein
MTIPQISVMFVRGERAYIIMGAQQNDADISAAFDHVLKTWQ